MKTLHGYLILFFTVTAIFISSCTVKLTRPEQEGNFTTNQRRILLVERKIRREQLKEAEKEIFTFREKDFNSAEWVQFQVAKGMLAAKRGDWDESCQLLERASPHRQFMTPETLFHFYLFSAMCAESRGEVRKSLALMEEALSSALIDVHRLAILAKRVTYALHEGLPESVIQEHLQAFEFAAHDFINRPTEEVNPEVAEFLWEGSVFSLDWFRTLEFSRLVKVMQWVQNPRSKCLIISDQTPWDRRCYFQSKKEYELLLRLVPMSALKKEDFATEAQWNQAKKEEIKDRLNSVLELVHQYELEFPVPFPKPGHVFQFKLNEMLTDVRNYARRELAKIIGTYVPVRKGPLKERPIPNRPLEDDSVNF